jgi:hypothetical protein
MALKGEAYCVVFNTWTETSRFLTDPFTAFDSAFGISHSVSQGHPALLYVLNSNGLPPSTRSSDFANTSVRQLQAQFDSLQRQVDSCALAFQALACTQDEGFRSLRDHLQQTSASNAALSNVMACSLQLMAANSRLEGLLSDCHSSHLLLSLTPSECADTLTSHAQAMTSVHAGPPGPPGAARPDILVSCDKRGEAELGEWRENCA